MWQTPNSKHDSNTQFSRTLFHSFDQNEDEEKFLNQPFIQDSFNSVHTEKLEHLNSPIKGETQTLKQYKSTEDLEKFKNLQEIKNNNPYFRERTISDERNFLIARAKKFHKNCKINLLSMLIYFVILVISQSFLFSYVRNTDLEDPKICETIQDKYYICDVNPEESFRVLKEIKEKYKNTENKPPFYGVPFAVKNSINCKNFLNDFGCVNLLNYISQEDAVIVQILKEQGAIPICTTNISQCYQGNTQNAIWGSPHNIFSDERQAGGSSGGSCLLVANKLVPFALGSGSIKSPAIFNGVIGFCPSPCKISNIGVRSVLDGSFEQQTFHDISMVIGPITKTVQDAIYFCQNTYQLSNCFDPYCSKQQFQILNSNPQFNNKKTINFGYVLKDSFCPLTQMQKNVIEETAPKEEILEQLNSLKILSKIPKFLKGKFLQYLIKIIFGNRSSQFFRCFEPLSLQEYQQLLIKKDKLLKEFFQTWNKMEIDCLILPTTRFGVADLLDIDIFLDESYFTFSNAIHTCSGIVPLRLSTSKDITDVFDLAFNLAQKIRENSSNLGILITDNGILGSMVMNKQKGIRAGQCTNKYLAGMTRKHNNANVMVLGTDLVPLKQYQNFFKEFMENQFDFSEETPQHGKRVDKITKLEQNGVYKQI
ncbi:Sugar-phosphate isomerase, RpiB/LacA/LacB family [Pseudocohnilembus persalinus]|uniref:Sugar-phosphate isomerase, RpiB/LacA/LacB family n=1 Tax=Pseudocohnilembus persalinus TaxID=266149 RepID=A0A0V0R127_PSEPJ|nr:Sugar-phosphate isomerase, RpiB/LacA/LacB family [Pseudocohnilembus persalinus]|eukprot:KRX08193.1 Sugar-phosphate isomerase, RpiB/LacA/LacB family [Pseudocohnilembus persalinus]